MLQRLSPETETAPSVRLQILIQARALIADRKHWTQGAYARDRKSRVVHPLSDTAVRFCAIGALARAEYVCTGHTRARMGDPPHEWRIGNIHHMTQWRLEEISEEKGHAAVLAAFDDLILRSN